MSPELPPDSCADTVALLRLLQPRRFLLAGASQTLASAVAAALADVHIEQKSLDELRRDIDQLPIYDVIVLVNVVEKLDKGEADALLGRLRDLHARHLLVFVPMGGAWTGSASHWQQTDLLALGFSLYKRYAIDQRDLHLYCFELDTYKPTPEWLNNKYWANPELFGKYRW